MASNIAIPDGHFERQWPPSGRLASTGAPGHPETNDGTGWTRVPGGGRKMSPELLVEVEAIVALD
jgi:hypothetical protein